MSAWHMACICPPADCVLALVSCQLTLLSGMVSRRVILKRTRAQLAQMQGVA